jgi:hypothetical protein
MIDAPARVNLLDYIEYRHWDMVGFGDRQGITRVWLSQDTFSEIYTDRVEYALCCQLVPSP